MKTCKVYELRVREEQLPLGTTLYHQHYLGFNDHVDYIDGKGYLLNSRLSHKTTYTPIQKFPCHKLPSYLKYPFSDDYEVDETFIVIDKDLDKLLMGKYLDNIKTLKEELLHYKGMTFWSKVKFLFNKEK